MASLADLVVSLSARTAAFESSIRRASDSARRDMGEIRQSVERVNGAISGLGKAFGAIAGIIGVANFSDFARSTLDAATNTGFFAKQIGANVQGLTELQYAVGTYNIAADRFNVALQRQTRRISEAADGTGVAASALKELGLSAKQLETLTADQQFLALAEAMKGIEGQADKVRIAFRLWDKGGVELLRTMEDGSGYLQEMSERARELGAVFDEEAAAGAAAATGSLSDLQIALEATARQLALKLAPSIADSANWLIDHLVPALKVAVENIETIAKVTLIFASAGLPALLAKTASGALAAAQAMKTLAIAMATNPIGLIAVGISTAVTALYLFRDEAIKVGDTVATVGDFIKAAWQETGGRLLSIAQEAWEGVSDETIGFLDVAKQVGADIIDVFVGTWKATIQDAKALINNLVGLFVAVGQSIGVVAATIVSAFQNAFSNVAKLASAFWQGLQNVFSGDIGFDAFRQQLKSSFVDPMANAVNEVQERFSSAFTTDYVGIVGEGIGKAADEAKLALSDLGTAIQKSAAESRKAREEANKLADETGGVVPPAKTLADLLGGPLAKGLDKTGDKASKAGKALEELAPWAKKVVESIKEQRDEYQRIQGVYENYLDSLKDEIAQLTLSEEAYRKYKLTREGITGVMQENVIALQQQRDALVAEQDALAENAEAQKRFVDSVSGAFDSLWSDMIQGSKSAAEAVFDTIKSLLLGIAQTILKNKIVIPIATAIAPGAAGATTASGDLTGGLGGIFKGGLSFLGGNSIGTGFEQFSSGIFGGASQALNFEFGLAGLAGGFLGDKLFGGAGGLGGSLGATAGLAAGIANLTTVLGAFAGPVGALLGALAGGALGGLFGNKEPSNKAAFGSIDLSTLETTTGGFTGKKSPSEETLAIRDAFLETIVATVQGIEKLGGEAIGKLSLDIGEREGVQANFGLGAGVEQFGKDAEAALEGIIERIVMDAEGLSEPFKQLIVLAEGVEDTLKQIESLSIIQQVLDSNPFEDYARAVEQSQQSLWDAAIAQRDATLQLVNAYDGSVAATQELAVATQQSYQAIVAVIAQIDQLAQGISDSFSSSIESIQLSILDTEQKYEFYRQKATEAFASLQSAVDPQEIARAAQEFEKYANAAFNLIPEEDRKEVANQFIDAFQKAEEIAQAGFEEAREATKQAAAEMKQAIQEAFVEITAGQQEAAAAQQQAADTQLQAANTPQQIIVDVSSAEAGY